MNATFRLRRAILYQGLAFTAIFLCVTLAHYLLFFLDNPQAQGFKNKHAAAQLGCFAVIGWGSMTMLSGYLLAAYLVERFSIKGTTIHIRSVFQNKQFDASSIRELVWNAKSTGGKFILRTATSQATLHLYGFSHEDRLRIIRILRQVVPPNVQTGWADFCHFIALPLREGRLPRRPGSVIVDPMTLPEQSRVLVTRRRYDWIFGALLLLSTAGATIAWLGFGNPRAFVALLYIPIFWGLLRFSTPKQGRWQAKWTGTKETKLVGIAHLLLPIMFVAMLACKLAGFDAMIVMWTGLAILFAICAVSIRHSMRREKQQHDKDRDESHSSAQQWEAAEADNLAIANPDWHPLSL